MVLSSAEYLEYLVKKKKRKKKDCAGYNSLLQKLPAMDRELTFTMWPIRVESKVK